MSPYVITLAITAGSVGFLIGFVVNHSIEAKYIKDMLQIDEEYIAKLKIAHEKHEADLKKIINRYQELFIKPESAKVSDLYSDFNNVDQPLPDGWEEIDFGGNF